MKFQSMTVCLDMRGCPNRCRHCWLGCTPNGHMPVSELADAAQAFRPYTRCLEVYDWYREPDYPENYQEMWRLCGKLSDRQTPHYELISSWRMARDPQYAPWLSGLGLRAAQLTLFGGEKTTDYCTGRKGAYGDILAAIESLLQHQISPRIQVFVTKKNIGELAEVEKLLAKLDLESRCRSFGGEFAFFLHQGSCDGENEKQYGAWVTPDDLPKIPPALAAYTLKYFGKSRLEEVFGRTEQSLVEELREDASTASYVTENPVFYVDRNFDVYPNVAAPAPYWRLGNLKADGPKAILENYIQSRSTAQHRRLTVPIGEMVRQCGDPSSRRLFTKGDYIDLMVNRYCRL